jgi:hypothetical protein
MTELGGFDNRSRPTCLKAMKKFFQKSLVENRIIGPDGEFIPFLPIDGGVGVLETSDEPTIALLEKMIAERRGGISTLTEEEFAEAKKKQTDMPSQRSLREEPLRVMSLPSLGGEAAAVPVVEAVAAAVEVLATEQPEDAKNGPTIRRAPKPKA